MTQRNTDPAPPQPPGSTKSRSSGKRKRSKKGPILLLGLLLASLLLRNHVRTLASLRPVPGSNAYVMDYYVDYRLGEITANGMDTHNIEQSLMRALFPDFIVPIATFVKRWYIPTQLETVDQAGHHCSSVFLQARDGDCYFARNHDWMNDAYLILRIHDRDEVASVAVIDLAYLNLDRPDLAQTNWIRRIPLLFAPYYAMDGMNRHGVAVGVMSVDDVPVIPARDSSKKDITNSTLMRIILDNARSIDEAIKIVNDYNVYFVDAPQHILIADSSGRSSILEHVQGEIKRLKPSSNWQVCTNHQMHGNSEQQNDDQCARYRAGSAAAEQLGSDFEFADVEALIRTMSVDNWTMWTSVYNLNEGTLSVGYKAAMKGMHRDSLRINPSDRRVANTKDELDSEEKWQPEA